nr:hypothetical protein [Tanacetum cinerariifolium]
TSLLYPLWGSSYEFSVSTDEPRKKEKLLQLEQWAYLNTHPSKRLTSFCYDDDDDEDYTFAITPNEPILSTKEPDNSLKSDEFIKSSVETLIPIPSESEGIPEHMCDVTFHDNSPPLDVSKDQFEDFSESNDDISSIDDDSFSFEKIDYVEASPPDSELVSSEVMEIVIPKVGGIDGDILLTIKDDILNEKLLNDDDYDSERDILILKDLPSNNTLSLAEKESFHFDIPSFSRPPAKPPDGDT